MVHILLVEDNRDDYEASVRSLQKNDFGHPVHWCKNGEQALAYLFEKAPDANGEQAQTPDLILLDLNMPGIDGRQVLKQLKHHDTLKRIPVVILTTSADPIDVDHCYDIGANSYIQKPVEFDNLSKMIVSLKDYWLGKVILPPHEAQAVLQHD